MTETKQMSIHRALAELKTLDSRINSAITQGSYCVANKKQNQKIAGESIEDFKKVMQGSYDKVESLIALRNRIKTMIVASNSTTLVTVGGVEMTVATAIERKSSIQYEESFLYTLRSQYSRALQTVTLENEKLPSKLETYLQNILGSKEQAKVDEVEAHTKLFMDKNTYDLIDPNQLRKRIEAMDEAISAFKVDVDAVLSEANAITLIEVEM
jgi:hypothetical protein